MYDEAYIRNFTDTFRYSWNRMRMVEAALPSGESGWAYHMDIAKYHSRADAFAGNRISYLSDDNKGCVLVPRSAPIQLSPPTEAHAVPLDAEALKIFDNLMRFISANKLNVLFVIPPYQLEEGHMGSYLYMEKALAQLGYDVWNGNYFYDEMGLDENMDFFDNAHANIFGAEKYTAYLGNLLSQTYGLPNRHELPEYAAWGQSYDRWAALKDGIKQQIIEESVES